VEDARTVEGGVGVRERPASAAAWAAHEPRRPAAGWTCPDRAVDGAYRALRASVERGLALRTGSSDLAEDLTQDVFVDLLLAARCRPPSNTRAWLARVAQRHLADTIGLAVRERAARALLESANRGQGPAADADTSLAIRLCLARLSEPQQRIVALRLLQGLSFTHCGLRLGMSEDAARMRFRRALQTLRSELGRAGVEVG
jgi:RNA polymerase sigma factor (sigma-70 family)